jgi:hypothetical protein
VNKLLQMLCHGSLTIQPVPHRIAQKGGYLFVEKPVSGLASAKLTGPDDPICGDDRTHGLHVGAAACLR